jgi:hypothetical protein
MNFRSGPVLFLGVLLPQKINVPSLLPVTTSMSRFRSDPWPVPSNPRRNVCRSTLAHKMQQHQLGSGKALKQQLLASTKFPSTSTNAVNGFGSGGSGVESLRPDQIMKDLLRRRTYSFDGTAHVVVLEVPVPGPRIRTKDCVSGTVCE